MKLPYCFYADSNLSVKTEENSFKDIIGHYTRIIWAEDSRDLHNKVLSAYKNIKFLIENDAKEHNYVIIGEDIQLTVKLCGIITTKSWTN